MNQSNPFTLLGEALLMAIREAVRAEIQAALGHNGNGRVQTEVVPTAMRFLTVKQAAETSGLGGSTIRLLIRRRQLRAQRVGRRVIIKRSDLEKFLEANPIEVDER
jgi:excisionase family DNA binding protein